MNAPASTGGSRRSDTEVAVIETHEHLFCAPAQQAAGKPAAFSVSSALRIVEAVKQLIGRETCIIDTQGIIIASTSSERIGQFHAAALALIASGAQQLIINEDNQHVYPHCRPGINLPITADGVLQGVVGISGTQQETELFGKIVQAFIQEQIREISRTQRKMRSEELRSSFLSRWLLGSAGIPERELLAQARLLQIDMSAWNTVCVLTSPQLRADLPGEALSSLDAQHSLQQLLRSFGEQNTVADLGFYFILLLTETAPQRCEAICRSLLDGFAAQTGVALCAGIGTPVSSPQQLRQSFREAQIACNTASLDPAGRVRLFSSLRSDLLLRFVPKEYQRSLLQSVFGAYTEKELAGVMQLLGSYIRCSGSISAVAEELFIHKNTVQYRLRRLLETTGLDARQISDMTWLELLYKMYQTEQSAPF